MLQTLKNELMHFGAENDAHETERARRMLNITPDTGEFLSVLVRFGTARRVLEIGTSNGYSTLWLAEAAAAIDGHVTTLEVAEDKVAMARSTFARSGFLRRALDAGVSGYLLKDAPAEKLAEALRQVMNGGRAIDPQLALEAWSEADPLNDRERRVLRLAGDGRSANEIAEQLGLSHGTVRNYLSEAIGKLGVGNRIEAYRLAQQKGWL